MLRGANQGRKCQSALTIIERSREESVWTHEKQDQWYIYTAHYPKSLTKIPMLRMIICNGAGWIVEVTDVEEKKGKIIADCDPRKGSDYGPYFSTYSDDRGHLELCRHLLSYGIGGEYKKYVAALDEGKEALADELSGIAMIRFSTRMTKEKFEDWDIDMSFWEDGDEKEDETEVDPEEETDEDED